MLNQIQKKRRTSKTITNSIKAKILKILHFNSYKLYGDSPLPYPDDFGAIGLELVNGLRAAGSN
jgi:hypothetical protein